jgi:hypothetical protein
VASASTPGSRLPDPAEAASRGPRRWLALALVAGVLAIYAQTLAFEFVSYDDDQYVTSNRFVVGGLSREGIAFAFSRGELSEGHTPHPLTWLSLMLDAELFGLHAGGFHATSLALHAASALLLFAALHGLTRAPWCSAAAAALWAWHPLRVESVAWISERKDVLAGVFAMLTLWCYALHARRGSRWAWWGTVVSFALGLMSKPTLVPLPFALLLLDHWPLARQRPFASRLFEKWPLFALSLISGALTLEFHRGWTTSAALVSPLERLANAAVAIVVYLGKLVCPAGLAPLYPHPYIPAAGGTPPSLAAIVACALLLAVLTFAALGARRRPYLAVGWLWFLVMLAPTLGIVQVGQQAFADRYTQLPSIGVCLAIVWAGAELLARVRTPALRRCLVAAAVLAFAAYAAAAFVQTRIWRDSETLYRHTLTVSPRATLIYFNLAAWLRQHGRADEAVAVYERAAARNPQDARAQYLLGVAYQLEGRLPEAIEQYRAAARLDPSNPKIRRRLQAALARQLGP